MITKTILEKTINWTPFLWLLNENYGKTNKVFVNSFRKLKTRSAKKFSLCFYNIFYFATKIFWESMDIFMISTHCEKLLYVSLFSEVTLMMAGSYVKVKNLITLL